MDADWTPNDADRRPMDTRPSSTGARRVAGIFPRFTADPISATLPARGNAMPNSELPPFIFHTHTQAEEAVRALIKSGFDAKKLSLIGRGYQSEEKPIGFYTVGDRIKSWGGMGAFWGGIWGLLLSPAVFVLPGLGLMAMAGPLVAVLVSALEGAALVGGVSALAAALSEIGVPKDQVVKYEQALKMNSFVLLVHGSTDDRSKAQSILAETKTYAVA